MTDQEIHIAAKEANLYTLPLSAKVRKISIPFILIMCFPVGMGLMALSMYVAEEGNWHEFTAMVTSLGSLFLSMFVAFKFNQFTFNLGIDQEGITYKKHRLLFNDMQAYNLIEKPGVNHLTVKMKSGKKYEIEAMLKAEEGGNMLDFTNAFKGEIKKHPNIPDSIELDIEFKYLGFVFKAILAAFWFGVLVDVLEVYWLITTGKSMPIIILLAANAYLPFAFNYYRSAKREHDHHHKKKKHHHGTKNTK